MSKPIQKKQRLDDDSGSKELGQKESREESLLVKYNDKNIQKEHLAFFCDETKKANEIRFKQVLETIDNITEVYKETKDERIKLPALRYSCIRLLGFLSYETNSHFKKSGGDQFLDFFNLPAEVNQMNQMRNRLLHKHHEYTDEDIKEFVTSFVKPLKSEISIKLDGCKMDGIKTPDIMECNLYKKQLTTIIEEKKDIKASNRSSSELEKDFRNLTSFLKSFSDKISNMENEFAGFYTLMILGELHDEVKFNKLETSLNKEDLEDLQYYYETYHKLSHSGDINKYFEDVVGEANYLMEKEVTAPNAECAPTVSDKVKQSELSNKL